MPALPRAVFSKPMSTGDSTLMMLLSLNLLLLVFFVLLNSMAAYGEKQAKEAMAKADDGLPVPMTGSSGEGVPDAPQAAWRAGVLSRLQGMAANRLDLRIAPQQGSADTIEIEMPLSAVFGADGRVARPEILSNLKAAAGSESVLTWQIKGGEGQAVRLASLATATGQAEWVRGSGDSLRAVVRPGLAARPETGLQVQQVGEGAGGEVRGVDEEETR